LCEPAGPPDTSLPRSAVARIVPYQIVEHAGHRAESGDRPGLVNVEMRRAHQDAQA
jgi:hypothetical protein